MKNYWIILFLLSTLGHLTVSAQFSRLNAASVEDVDDIVEAYMTDSNLVGVSIGIVKDGEIALLKGYGYADQANETEATECTMYRVASVAKTFTAVAALQLIEEGKLAYEDDIRKYVPEYPEKSQGPIKVVHLLQHTSCINNGSLTDPDYIDNNATFNAIEAVERFSSDPLRNSCFIGSSGNYSNWGFNLLGAVIERAAGCPYETVILRNIVKPLNMPLFQPEYYWRAPYPNQSEGYNSSQNLVNSPEGRFIMHLPSGGFISSVTDLTLFAKGLVNNTVFDNESTKNELFSLQGLPYNFRNVAGFSYSLGMRSEIRNGGRRYYFHNGDVTKSSTIIYFSDDIEDAVAIMINRTSLGQGVMVPFAQEIIDIVPALIVDTPDLYNETNIPADNLILLNGIEAGEVVEVARNIIAEDYLVSATADVKLDGESIVLRDGFRAVEGSYFLAHLGNVNTGCSEQ